MNDMYINKEIHPMDFPVLRILQVRFPEESAHFIL